MNELPASLQAPKFSKIVLPFINTRPATDIGLFILLLPFWWVLGVEQFIWPIGFALITLKLLSNGRNLYTTPTLKWLTLFLLVHLISGLFIVESFRYVTFVRNFSTYILAFFTLLAVINGVTKLREIKFVVDALIGMMALAALAGLLGILGIWDHSFNFTSLIGEVLPGWIVKTRYGSLVAQRALGNYGWFVGIGTYFRVSSFFLFPTHYASAIVLTLPLLGWRLHQSRRISSKIFFTFILLLLLLNLASTTGRIAIIGGLVGWAFFLATASKIRTIYKILLVGAVLAGAIAILLVPQYVIAGYENFTLARGTGSFDRRSTVYEESLAGAWERPFFGWGTERDFPDTIDPTQDYKYPAGITQLLPGYVIQTWFYRAIGVLRYVVARVERYPTF